MKSELLNKAIRKMSYSSSEFWRQDISELKEIDHELEILNRFKKMYPEDYKRMR